MEQYEAFIKKVAEMRKEQKSYFATRSQVHLKNSKELEKIIDNIIANYFNDQLTLNF